MVEEGPGPADSDLPAAEPLPRHDFSAVQGFQVVGAGEHGAAEAGDQAWRDALRLELEARAARLHQAVDAAIVLSNDGRIRWLGDPVAKLSLGPDVLNPSAVILADEALPVAARETVKTRIELWIAATTRRILAPLFALEAMQEGSEIVRNLAHALVLSLGVLEREPIKAKVKALVQEDRAELRKQGVRFGAYYLFVPALLKPASRALALQLWSLQAPGDASEFLATLGPIASSGRTSLSLDNGISKEGYRVAGYRMCGERIVRVDVVERLAGMIRAALAGEAPAPGLSSHRASKGFVVSGEMTSLTGCSGERFASILRSMGFRMIEMKRSDFFESKSTNEAAGHSESPTPAGHSESIAANPEAPAEPLADETTIDAAPVSSPTEPLIDAVSENLDAASESADAVAEGTDAIPVDRASLTFADASLGALEADASVQTVSAVISGLSGNSEKNADMVMVWRPEHRKISPRRQREAKQSESGAPSCPEARGPDPVPRAKRLRETPPHPHAKLNRPNLTRADEKRRQRPKDYDMAPSNPTTAPQHNAKVDPNSPFAKLLELRPLLEKQANKSQ